jgi:hypothetical protein
LLSTGNAGQYLFQFAVALALLSAVLKHWDEILDSFLSFVRSRDQAKEMTLHERKAEVCGRIRESPTTYLVVIDDIDRLPRDQVAQVFQLIKANSDFPRLTYLLLFDRIVVERALDVLVEEKGKDYLAKIVQVSLNIPSADRSKLDHVLFTGLDRLLLQGNSAKYFDRNRWSRLYSGGLVNYFNTLREVKRFLSTLGFHMGVFRAADEQELEVNPVDLITIEVLRTREPVVYARVQQSREALCNDIPLLMNDRARQEQVKRTVEHIMAGINAASRESMSSILEELFPSASSALSGRSYSSGRQGEWLKELRIAHSRNFDRYFLFSLRPEEVTESEMTYISSHSGEREQLVAVLKKLTSRGAAESLLVRLEYLADGLAPECTEEFLKALCDTSDEFPERTAGFMEVPSQVRLGGIAYRLLQKIDDARAREHILERVVRESQNLSMPISLVDSEQRSSDSSGKESEEKLLVDTDAALRLKMVALERIRREALAGTLISNRRAAFLLTRWEQWGEQSEARDWASKWISTSNRALAFLGAFVNERHSYGLSEPSFDIRHWMNLGAVEKFIDLSKLTSVLKGVEQLDLSVEDNLALSVFNKALDRRRESLPDDNWERDELLRSERRGAVDTSN